MFETIKGNVRGSMTVIDNINFYGYFYISIDAPIEIMAIESYPWSPFIFYGDGISECK